MPGSMIIDYIGPPPLESERKIQEAPTLLPLSLSSLSIRVRHIETYHTGDFVVLDTILPGKCAAGVRETPFQDQYRSQRQRQTADDWGHSGRSDRHP